MDYGQGSGSQSHTGPAMDATAFRVVMSDACVWMHSSCCNGVTVTVTVAEATFSSLRRYVPTSGLRGPRQAAPPHAIDLAACTDLGDPFMVAAPTRAVACFSCRVARRESLLPARALQRLPLLAWADLGAGRVPRKIFRAHCHSPHVAPMMTSWYVSCCHGLLSTH